MTSSKKVVFFVFISFLTAFAIFFTTMASLPDYVYEQHEKFYSQSLPENKIFIFGSSQTYAINPITVEEYLNKEGHDYTIYHLGQCSFDTEERLRTVDLVISQKPEIVIYGIAYQTFYSHGRNITEKPIDSFVSPPKITDLLSSIQLPINTGLLNNPKFATLNTFNHVTQNLSGNFEDEPVRPYPNTPFFVMEENASIPAEEKDLKVGGQIASFKGKEIYPIENNRTFAALKELIHNLNDNEIEVIIFTTPHLKNWLTQVPIEQKKIFDSMLNDLENEFDFKVFRLHDKYDALDIWANHDHLISHDKKMDFYAEEIAKMLLTRIDE